MLSITSIFISVQNEAAMRRLVTANSWPYLQLGHGNSREGERVIHFDVSNAGIGPATLEKMVVSYAGKPVATARELLIACCDVANLSHVEIDSVARHVFAPREHMSFLQVGKTLGNDVLWEKLNTERFKVDLKVCYSSVFAEYWITSLRDPKPVSVPSCDGLGGPAYEAALYEEPGRKEAN
jgi:hypothetical protein